MNEEFEIPTSLQTMSEVEYNFIETDVTEIFETTETTETTPLLADECMLQINDGVKGINAFLFIFFLILVVYWFFKVLRWFF